jgi:hypothetical protein
MFLFSRVGRCQHSSNDIVGEFSVGRCDCRVHECCKIKVCCRVVGVGRMRGNARCDNIFNQTETVVFLDE